MIGNTLDTGSLNPFGDEWRIENELGRGSFGVVYRIARTDDSGMLSAMKWIPLPDDDLEISRMLAEGNTMTEVRAYYERLRGSVVEEIKLLNKLRGNSHIVSLEDYRVVSREGTDAVGFDIFIRMELLTPLTEYLKTHRMTFRDIIRLGVDLCSALADCGRLSIIHRDIKPDNIFVSSDEEYFKLGDFGIARQLQQGADALKRVGSPAYMAPEVYRTEDYDQRADIYSLGLVLYRLLNGRRDPFVPADMAIVPPDEEEKAVQVRMSGRQLPPPSRLPDGLVRLGDVVKKACAYDVEARYQTPEDMAEALKGLLALPGLDEEALGPRRDRSKPEQSRNGATERVSGSDAAKQTPSSSFTDVQGRNTVSSGTLKTPPPPAPKPKEQQGGFVTDEEEKTKPQKTFPVKKLLIAAAALIVIAAVGLIALLMGKGRGGITVTADSVGTTAVSLSWTVPEALADQQAVLRLLSNAAVVSDDRPQGATTSFTGLAPDTEYTVELTVGDRKATARFRTAVGQASAGMPRVSQVQLSALEKFYLDGYETINDVPENCFDFLNDGRLDLRTAPMDAQTKQIVLWVAFEPVREACEQELIMALTPQDGAVYSGSIPLKLRQSGTLQSFSLPIDDLLDRVYSAYGRWPEGRATLRLYLSGVSVDEIGLTF